MLSLILLVAAFVLFLLATLGVPSQPRRDEVEAGLACLTAVQLLAVAKL